MRRHRQLALPTEHHHSSSIIITIPHQLSTIARTISGRIIGGTKEKQ
jgi:hypothetical protein